MTLSLLLTDKCFLMVLLLGLCVVLNGLRKEPIRQAFLAIFQRPISASAAIILLFFLGIAILDSVHYKPAEGAIITKKHHTALVESRSIIDHILAPLGDMYEKTYSAPLALELYTKETLLQGDIAEQIYPRLNYVPDYMQTRQDKQAYIKSCCYDGFVVSLCLTSLVWALGVLGAYWYARRTHRDATFQCMPNAVGMSALITFFVCVLCAIVSYKISRELHVLGTGKIGQDIFYYAIKSIRTGLVIGILTTLFMMPLALFLGICAGYYGGIIDDVIQYIYTTLSSIPGVLLITASVLSMQTYIVNHPHQFTNLAQSADARLLALCLILGVTSWTSLCRLLRAETLKLREMDFVQAAITLGSGSFKIICKHLLPNVVHIVIITLVLDFSFLVLAEAVLAYVGVGVSPMTISWGNMINAARLELSREPIVWWPMMSAFLFMFVLVLASNLFADAVRDAFDPHQAR